MMTTPQPVADKDEKPGPLELFKMSLQPLNTIRIRKLKVGKTYRQHNMLYMFASYGIWSAGSTATLAACAMFMPFAVPFIFAGSWLLDRLVGNLIRTIAFPAGKRKFTLLETIKTPNADTPSLKVQYEDGSIDWTT